MRDYFRVDFRFRSPSQNAKDQVVRSYGTQECEIAPFQTTQNLTFLRNERNAITQMRSQGVFVLFLAVPCSSADAIRMNFFLRAKGRSSDVVCVEPSGRLLVPAACGPADNRAYRNYREGAKTPCAPETLGTRCAAPCTIPQDAKIPCVPEMLISSSHRDAAFSRNSFHFLQTFYRWILNAG